MNRTLARKWLRKAAVVGGKTMGSFHPSKRRLGLLPEEVCALAVRSAESKVADVLGGPFPSERMSDGSGLHLTRDSDWELRWAATDAPVTFGRGGAAWMTGCGLRSTNEDVFDVVAMYHWASNTLFHASLPEGNARRNNDAVVVSASGGSSLRMGVVQTESGWHNAQLPDIWGRLMEHSSSPPMFTSPLSAFAAVVVGEVDAVLFHGDEVDFALDMGMSYAVAAGCIVLRDKRPGWAWHVVAPEWAAQRFAAHFDPVDHSAVCSNRSK